MSTKILASALSPFGGRLRMACAFKGLDLPFEPAPGGTGSAELKQINPFGQIPVLIRGDTVLIESLALLDYLEDTYPKTRSLRPGDPTLAARVRMIGMAFDNRVIRALQPMFVQLAASPPDVAVVLAALDAATTELEKLATFMDERGTAVGSGISNADCAMAPFAWLIGVLAPKFGVSSPFERVPRFARWWSEMQQESVVAEVTTGMQQALVAFMTANK